MTFNAGAPIQPLEDLLNQAVDEGKAYTDSELAVVPWTVFTPTVAANFTAGTCRYHKFGPIVEVRLAATYNGSTVTASSAGNISPNFDMFTGVGFPAGSLPSETLFVSAHKGTVDSLVQMYFYPTGQVRIVAAFPNSTIASGDVLEFVAIYMVG